MSEEMLNILAWSAAFAFLAAIGAVIFIIVKYKRKLKSPIYPIGKYASLSLNASEDTFLGRSVTAVRISSDKKD